MEKTLEKENIMGSMSEGKLLFKMAMPMIFSVLVSSLYNLVDSIFVGRLGNAALTAISLGAPASSLMVEFSFGLAIGLNALLSKKLGEKDSAGVQKVVGQGFLLTALLYLIFLLAGIFASEAFFRLQTSDEEIIALGKEYTSIVMIFSFGLMLQSLTERLLSATGRTQYSRTALYELIPSALLSLFSASGKMLSIGIDAFRIIGTSLIISGITIMASGVFQATGQSRLALVVSIVQAVTLVGSAVLLAQAKSVTLVWVSFPISEAVIFALSIFFLRGIWKKQLNVQIS